MKLRNYLFILLASAFAFVSCGPEEPEEGLNESIILRSVSVAEGEEVSSSLEVITLEYNKVVVTSETVDITLNGVKVTTQKNPISGMRLDVKVALADEADYTLSIPAGAVLQKDDLNQTAKAFTLHFTTKAVNPGGDEISVKNMVGALGFGWNLGNHFDTQYNDENGEPTDFTKPNWGYWDGAHPTKALYESLSANGVKTVRLPVTWGHNQTNNEEYTINEEYFAEVAENVQWALDCGMYVILNMHHDEYWQDIIGAAASGEKDSQIRKRIEATWRQIATYFKDYDEHLIFETFNELHDDAWGWQGGYNYRPVFNLMDQWNQLAVNSIRATGGNNATRWIGVPGFCASVDFTCGSKNTIKVPTDPANRIMVAIHSYTPFDFCTQGTRQRWGHTYKGNDSDENEIKNIFNTIKSSLLDKNIPCYMGEFGCESRLDAADEPYRTYFVEYFCRCAYLHGIPVMLWDNDNNSQGTGGGGECFWYVSHNDGTIHTPELLRTMVEAATSTKTSYTLESVYEKAPK